MNMTDRPKLKIKKDRFDLAIEVSSLILLVFFWCFCFLTYKDMPDTIPTHFDAFGKADAYGSKNHIWGLPIVSSIIYIGISILNNFPHIFNYPLTITEENAEKQYRWATKLLRILKIVIVIIFFMIAYSSSNYQNLGASFLPFIFALIFIPLLYFIYYSVKSK